MSNTHTLILRKVIKDLTNQQSINLTIAEKSYTLPFIPFNGMNLMLDDVVDSYGGEDEAVIPKRLTPRNLTIELVAWSEVENAWVAWLKPWKKATPEQLIQIKGEDKVSNVYDHVKFDGIWMDNIDAECDRYFRSRGWEVKYIRESVGIDQSYFHELANHIMSFLVFKDDGV